MTRRVLYVASALRPTEHEVADACRARFDGDPSRKSDAERALRANLDRAMAWLSWLHRSFPETTFIAPWIASVLAGANDADPAQREAGLTDDCAVIERCDGIVLCGPRISEGMRREMEHGVAFRNGPVEFEVAIVARTWPVYDLTSYQIEGASGRNEDRRTFAEWMRGYQESRTR